MQVELFNLIHFIFCKAIFIWKIRKIYIERNLHHGNCILYTINWILVRDGLIELMIKTIADTWDTYVACSIETCWILYIIELFHEIVGWLVVAYGKSLMGQQSDNNFYFFFPVYRHVSSTINLFLHSKSLVKRNWIFSNIWSSYAENMEVNIIILNSKIY